MHTIYTIMYNFNINYIIVCIYKHTYKIYSVNITSLFFLLLPLE